MNRHSSSVKLSGLFSLCLRVLTTLCLCAVFLQAQSGGIVTQDEKAKEALNAAIKGLGGADRIGSINSLVFKGTETFFIQGNQTPSRDFEIRILLPDSIVQINNVASGMQTAVGFSREKRLPAITVPDEATLNAIVNEMKNEWAYVLIGMLAKGGPMPLTLSSGSTPGALTVTTKTGMAGEMEFDVKNLYPSVVRYRNTRLKNDYEIKFQNRFSVNGIMFPKIITFTDPMAERVLSIDDVQINPELNLKDFEQFSAGPKPKM